MDPRDPAHAIVTSLMRFKRVLPAIGRSAVSNETIVRQQRSAISVSNFFQ